MLSNALAERIGVWAESNGAAAQPAIPSKLERLKEVAQETLGERAKKVLDMLSSAKDEKPESLRAICDEAVRFTGFFMSQEKAEELGRQGSRFPPSRRPPRPSVHLQPHHPVRAP